MRRRVPIKLLPSGAGESAICMHGLLSAVRGGFFERTLVRGIVQRALRVPGWKPVRLTVLGWLHRAEQCTDMRIFVPVAKCSFP